MWYLNQVNLSQSKVTLDFRTWPSTCRSRCRTTRLESWLMQINSFVFRVGQPVPNEFHKLFNNTLHLLQQWGWTCVFWHGRAAFSPFHLSKNRIKHVLFELLSGLYFLQLLGTFGFPFLRSTCFTVVFLFVCFKLSRYWFLWKQVTRNKRGVDSGQHGARALVPSYCVLMDFSGVKPNRETQWVLFYCSLSLWDVPTQPG